MVLRTTSYTGGPTRSSSDGRALVPRQAQRVATAKTTPPKSTVMRIRPTRSIKRQWTVELSLSRNGFRSQYEPREGGHSTETIGSVAANQTRAAP